MSLSLDGSVSANATASSVTTGTLTTTAGSGQIVVCTLTNGGPVTSVTSSPATLIFIEKPRDKVNTTGSPNQFTQVFTAPYTSNFSGTVTSNNTTSDFSTTTAFGIGGAATSIPFDTDASLAGTSTNANPAAVNTSNPNDFIFCNVVDTLATATAVAGWILISGTNFQVVAYQIVSSTQTGLVLPGSYTGGGNPAGGSVDAIVQGTGLSSLTSTIPRLIMLKMDDQ